MRTSASRNPEQTETDPPLTGERAVPLTELSLAPTHSTHVSEGVRLKCDGASVRSGRDGRRWGGARPNRG
jgi:hypothetical protein